MENTRDINSYFEGVLKNIDIILNDSFYKNKQDLYMVKREVELWYNNYKINKSLKCIEPEKLKNLDIEITDFFAQYVETEPAQQNYAERLSYDFSELEDFWKKEMLGDELNG